MLARQQPVATDLRIVVTSLRMSADLERSGDLAQQVAKLARIRYPEWAMPRDLRRTGGGEAARGDRGGVAGTDGQGVVEAEHPGGSSQFEAAMTSSPVNQRAHTPSSRAGAA